MIPIATGGLALNTEARNTGKRPWIISDEMSMNRLTKPSAHIPAGNRASDDRTSAEAFPWLMRLPLSGALWSPISVMMPSPSRVLHPADRFRSAHNSLATTVNASPVLPSKPPARLCLRGALQARNLICSVTS